MGYVTLDEMPTFLSQDGIPESRRVARKLDAVDVWVIRREVWNVLYIIMASVKQGLLHELHCNCEHHTRQ